MTWFLSAVMSAKRTDEGAGGNKIDTLSDGTKVLRRCHEDGGKTQNLESSIAKYVNILELSLLVFFLFVLGRFFKLMSIALPDILRR